MHFCPTFAFINTIGYCRWFVHFSIFILFTMLYVFEQPLPSVKLSAHSTWPLLKGTADLSHISRFSCILVSAAIINLIQWPGIIFKTLVRLCNYHFHIFYLLSQLPLSQFFRKYQLEAIVPHLPPAPCTRKRRNQLETGALLPVLSFVCEQNRNCS